jgi:hypothetical protein
VQVPGYRVPGTGTVSKMEGDKVEMRNAYEMNHKPQEEKQQPNENKKYN